MNEILYNYILIKGVEKDKILVIRLSRDPNTKEILKDVELKLTKAEKKDIPSICAKFIEDNKDSILQYSYEHVPTKTIKRILNH